MRREVKAQLYNTINNTAKVHVVPAKSLGQFTSNAIKGAKIGRVAVAAQGLEVDLDRLEALCCRSYHQRTMSVEID